MSAEKSWFSDDASAENARGLGRASFLDGVWDVIKQSETVESSTVFGLVGPWGIGKTSMVEWLAGRAESKEPDAGWTTVFFNPWDYQDPASLQEGFFAELTAAFGAPTRASDLRKRFAAFGRSVAPLASLGSLVGVDLSGSVEALSDLVDGDRSVGAARRDLLTSLQAAKTPVLVIIDDLDRVSAEELLLTLKLVRQLGRLPYVHYLLSYDEETILDVLTKTTLIGDGGTPRAQDYMEKVVQVRFDIPALRPTDALKMVNEGLNELVDGGWVQLDESASDQFATAYFAFLAARLRTPRAIRRYFAQLRLLAPHMAEELDYGDFLVLTWIRVTEPGVYALLQERRSDLVGGAGYLSHNRPTTEQLRERRDDWRRALEAAGPRDEHVEGVAQAVSYLFPKFDSAWRASHGSGRDAGPPHLANAAYFDRYFSFGVPEGDIADATVAAAVRAHSGGEADEAAAGKIDDALKASPDLVVGKISQEVRAQESESESLINWLAEIYRRIPKTYDIIAPASQLEAVTGARLRAMPAEKASRAISALAVTENVDFLARVLERATQDYADESTPALSLTDDALSRVRAALTAHFDMVDPLEMTIEERGTAWSWMRLDPESFGEWVKRARRTYDDLHMLGFFVNSSVSTGSRSPVSRLRGFDSGAAADHFDLAELQQRYASDIDAAAVLSHDAANGTLDSPQNRRLLALAGLRRFAATAEEAAGSAPLDPASDVPEAPGPSRER